MTNVVPAFKAMKNCNEDKMSTCPTFEEFEFSRKLTLDDAINSFEDVHNKLLDKNVNGAVASLHAGLDVLYRLKKFGVNT